MSHTSPPSASSRPLRRRLARCCIGLVLLLSTGVAALFFFRTPIVNHLAPLMLTRAGLGGLSIHLRDIGNRRVRIDSISGSVALNGEPLRLHLEQLEYDFTYRQLLTGRLEQLRIARAELDLPIRQQAAEGTAGAPADPVASLVRALRLVQGLQLPAFQVHIDSLVLRTTWQGQSLSTPPLQLDYDGGAAGGALLVRQLAGEQEGTPLALQLHLEGGELQGQMQLQAAALANWLPQILPLQRGTVALQLHLPASGKEAPLALCSLNLKGSALAGPGWHAASVQLDLEAAAAPDGRTLLFENNSRLQVQDLRSEGLQLKRGELPLQGHIGWNENAWRLEWRPRSAIALDGVRTEALALVPLTLHDLHLLLGHRAGGSELEADLRLAKANSRLHLRWTRTAAGSQQLALKTAEPLQLDAANTPLRLLATPPPFLAGVQIERGQLQAGVQVHWKAGSPVVRLDLDLRDGALRHGGLHYQGITLRQRVQLLPQLTSAPGTLEVAAIQGPLLVEGLKATFQLEAPAKKGGSSALLVQEAEMRIFDGRLEGKNCRYVPGRGGERCLVAVHDLDLAAILALHQVKGLSVSGRIDGSIPLQYTAAGPSVSNGELRSTEAGGIIRYQPPNEALKQSVYSEYTLRVLEDYHYHSLAATVDYQPDGTLIAGLQLQGSNPQMDSRRPVHLNLRTEQNLLSLWRSLQYSQGLTSELQHRVQEGLQPGQRQ